MTTTEKHFFSLHVTDISKQLQDIISPELIIREYDIVHRVCGVLRMKEGSIFYLFDQYIHVLVQVVRITKKELLLKILECKKNKLLFPKIVLFLPILKRTALEQAIYNATETGVSIIQLIRTTKSMSQMSLHEYARLEKIIIAAAEQSKYFNLAKILLPISIDQALKAAGGKKIWFDPIGQSFVHIITTLHKDRPEDITILLGPEGGFTIEEQKNILSHDFETYALTPTILRSVSAVTLAVGIIRTFV